MQKVSYMGNGSITEFYFNFPFFENSNVVVTVNNEPATGYYIVGTSGGMDADIPYIGGKVVFETAPTSIDCITIARQLPLERIVDYQPLSKIDPTTLNQDLNYLMEVIKDRKNELDDFHEKFADIIDKEKTDLLLEKIVLVNQNIANVAEEIAKIDGISDIMDNVDELQESVASNNTEIENLQTSVNNITQNPTRTVPNYSANPVVLSTTVNTWTNVPQSGALHVKFATTDVISWLTVILGTENNNISFAAHVNENDRISDVLYNVQAGQKFMLSPHNTTITTCELIPFC